MSVITFDVRRIEEHYKNKIVARIHAFKRGRAIAFQVSSSNELFKNHLESILNSPFYAVLPGPKTQGYSANHAEYFIPNTASYFTFLHDRLGWYGYVTNIMNKSKIIKSLLLNENLKIFKSINNVFIYNSETKSLADARYTRQNAQGETILIEVPSGYVAISKSGKVVKPGRKLAFNGVKITGPDAKWSVITDDQAQQLGWDTGGDIKDIEPQEGSQEVGTAEEIYLVKTDLDMINKDGKSKLERAVRGLMTRLKNFAKTKLENPTATYPYEISLPALVAASGAEDVVDLKEFLVGYGFSYPEIAELLNSYYSESDTVAQGIEELFSSTPVGRLTNRLENPGNFILVSRPDTRFTVATKSNEKVPAFAISYPTDIDKYPDYLEWDIYEVTPEMQDYLKNNTREEVKIARQKKIQDKEKFSPIEALARIWSDGQEEYVKNSQVFPEKARIYIDEESALPTDLQDLFRDRITQLTGKRSDWTPQSPTTSEDIARETLEWQKLQIDLSTRRNLDTEIETSDPNYQQLQEELAQYDRELEELYFEKNKVTAYGFKETKDGVELVLGGQAFTVKKKNQVEALLASRERFDDAFKLLQQSLQKNLIDESFYRSRVSSAANAHINEVLKITNFRLRGFFRDQLLIDTDTGQGLQFDMRSPRQDAPYTDDALSDVTELTDGNGTNLMFFDNPLIPAKEQGFRPYQVQSILRMSNPMRYAATGGPAESDGMMLQMKQGTGKTLTVIGADAVMRNAGTISGSHIVFAPNAVTTEWVATLEKFRRLDVIKPISKKDKTFTEGDIVHITTGQNKEEIEALFDHIATLDRPPMYIIVGNSKSSLQKTLVEQEQKPEEQEEGTGPKDQDEIYMKTPDEVSLEDKGKENKEEESYDLEEEFKLNLSWVMERMKQQLLERGSVGVVTIDEGGFYTNPQSNRTLAMKAFVESATSKYVPVRDESGKAQRDNDGTIILRERSPDERRAITFLLDGNISGNSPKDIMHELAFVNSNIRYDTSKIEKEYLEEVPVLEAKNSDGKPKKRKKPRTPTFRWKTSKEKGKSGSERFFGKYGKFLQKLTYQNTHGNERTLVFRDTIPTGRQFANVYEQALQLYELASQAFQDGLGNNPEGEEAGVRTVANYAFSLYQIMDSAANNTINPRILIDYDVSKQLFGTVREFLSDAEYAEFVEQISKYREKYCEIDTTFVDVFGPISLPATRRKVEAEDGTIIEEGYLAAERIRGFEEMVSSKYRNLMENIVQSGGAEISYEGKKTGFSWKNPFVDTVLHQIQEFIEDESNNQSGPIRIGMQSNNNRTIYAAKRAIESRTPISVNLIKGGMTADETRAALDRHNDTTKKENRVPMITLITSAGQYGISVQSPFAFVTPQWNAAKAEQARARFARNPKISVVIRETGASGIGLLMREIMQRKEIFDTASEIDFEDEDQVANFIRKNESVVLDILGVASKLRSDAYKLIVAD